jgi:3-oxoacyl-[acyl-carrier protein] reductase
MSADPTPDRPALAGRVAVVTGAASAPGRAVALALATAGAYVWCIDADADAAKETVSAVIASGGQADLQAADVTVQAEVDAAVGEILGKDGRIDVLCTVASQPGDGTLIEDIDADDFDRIFRGNFKATLFAAQAAGRAMVEAGHGSIISVLSGVIDVPVAGTGSYAVSAAAIAFLTKVLAKEAGDHGVRVNAIAAGPDAGFSPFPPDDEPALAAFAAKADTDAVLKRTGTADELGALAVFLASDADAAAVTGQTIRMSGGWTMPW